MFCITPITAVCCAILSLVVSIFSVSDRLNCKCFVWINTMHLCTRLFTEISFSFHFPGITLAHNYKHTHTHKVNFLEYTVTKQCLQLTINTHTHTHTHTKSTFVCHEYTVTKQCLQLESLFCRDKTHSVVGCVSTERTTKQESPAIYKHIMTVSNGQ